MSSSRDQIIETTCELLELQGYHATGLNQIIRESGSPKGSLYYYFPGGKEELAVEAVTHVGKIVLERIRTNLAQIDDPADAIRSFIMNIALNVEHSGFRAGGPITTIALETAATGERLRETCNGIYQDWQAAFRDKLTAGGFADDRATQLAQMIIATIEGGIILSRTGQSRTPLENVAQMVYELIH